MLLALENIWPKHTRASEISERDLRVADAITFRMKCLNRKFCMELMFVPDDFMCINALYDTFWEKWADYCAGN